MSTSVSTSDAGELAILESIATGVPLLQVLRDIVLVVERRASDMLCSILLLDADGRLHHGAAPSLPPAFTEGIDGSAIGPNEGSCGAAAATRQRIVVADIDSHPNWVNYKHLAIPNGLRACWSTPILSPQDVVLGTFAMYYKENRAPNDEEIAWVASATHLASIAIGRWRVERELRRSEARARELARLHAASSAINKLIPRSRNLHDLYAVSCRAAVEQGLARLAWIGLCSSSGVIQIVDQFGEVPTFEVARVDSNDAEYRTGLTKRAIATGEPAVSGDIVRDAPSDWRGSLEERGLKSCGVFPLKDEQRVIGVFVLYSSTDDYFRTEELQVLTALASDISFAISSHRIETERRRMQDVVRASEQMRAQIFDTAVQAMFYLQVEGPGLYRFVSVNKALLDLFKSEETRIVGKLLTEVTPAADHERVLKHYSDAIAARARETWEAKVRRDDGTKHVEVVIAPIFDVQGRCINFVGTVHDITARARAEAERTRLLTQLNQAQRMQALGTLAGGIAHDFNNILAAISGNATLLLQDAGIDTAQKTHVAEIQKASLRAIDLVRQILTFSRHAPPKREILEPSDVAREALNMLRATLSQTIAIETDIAADAPRIEGDATQFHQILMNLGTNAAHALPSRGGIIRFSLDRWIVEPAAPRAAGLSVGTYLRMQVADNGCGMDEMTVKRAFDPFFTTRQPGEGTGLGLSVVHGIVESHQGAVDLRSEVGKGTVVTVYFPASVGCVENKTPARDARGAGERVMYVDDEEALVFLIDRALTKMGYRVSGFSDPTIALSAFRARPRDYDVVITDLSMPRLSGPDLAVELRRIRPDVPIVMTSGFIRKQDVQTAERLGINQLIYKANTIEELGVALAKEIAKMSTGLPAIASDAAGS